MRPQRMRGAIALAVGGVLALLAALAGFTHPSADDFCFAVKARDLGFGGAQRHWYETWSGRYTATAAQSAFALAGDILRIYPLAPLVVLALTFASFALLVAAVARRWARRSSCLLAAGVLTVVYVAATPDPAQTFYWVSGAFTFQIGNILTVTLAALLVLAETRAAGDRAARLALFVAAAVVAIVAAGTNEVTLVLMLAALVAGSVLAFVARRPTRAYWLGLTAIAGAAAAVSVLAPGNSVRLAGVADDGMLRPHAALAALAFVPWVALRIAYWLSGIALWAGAWLLYALTRDHLAPRIAPAGRFDRRLLAIPLAWVGLLFLLGAIGFVVNRYPLPERAESVVALVFVLGWPASFIVVAHWVNAGRFVPRGGGVAPAAVLLLVGLLGAPTIFEAYKDVYRGLRYHREVEARFAELRAAAARGDADPIVASLSRPPRTLFATDFVTDPRNFRNSCAADYFGVRSIRLGASPP